MSQTDALLRHDNVTLSLFVEGLRSHVEIVGPRDRSRLGVDLDLRELGRIPKRLEYAPPLSSREIDVADCPVIKVQAKPILTDHFNCGDVVELHARNLMEGGRCIASALPGGHAPSFEQLVLMQPRPFGYSSARVPARSRR